MSRPVAFDFFCKAGGAGMGLHMAGFEVIGFDIEPQPNYPFKFYQVDVMTLRPSWIAQHADFVHSSPPCWKYSVTRHRSANKGAHHPDLVGPTRDLLTESGVPFMIENVEGAPLIDPTRVCGSSLGLRVQRHRLFESTAVLTAPGCDHEWQKRHQPYKVRVGANRAQAMRDSGRITHEGNYKLSGVMPVFGSVQLANSADLFEASVAMGINWMTKGELNQAIPPVYTYHLGKQILDQL